MRACQFVALCLMPWVAAIGLSQEGSKTDDPKLQGKWITVTSERNGKSTVSSPGGWAEVKGDKMTWNITVTLSGKETTIQVKTHVIKVDASKTPKQFDFEGYSEGTAFAIYEIDGDLLRICEMPPKKNKDGTITKSVRPTTFVSNNDAVIWTFKREKK